MKKYLLITILSFAFLKHSAQIQTTTSNLNRWSSSKGTFVLWYGDGEKATQFAAFTVVFDDSYTQNQIASELQKRVFLSTKYMTYEFLENFDCNATYGHLARKLNIKLSDIKDLRNGNCTDTQYQFLKPATTINYNKEAFSKMRPNLETRESALIKDGWEKIYEDYQNEGTAAEITFKTGYSYTGIGAVYTNGNANMNGQIVVFDDKNFYSGMKTFAENSVILIESNDFQPENNLTKATYLVNAADDVTTVSGLIIFQKPVDFKKDFYRLLEGRNNGFKDFKSVKGNKNTEDFQIYFSTVTLGTREAKINETTKTIEYVLVLDMKKAETLRFIDNIVTVMQELPAQGFKVEEYKNNSGGDVTEFSKNGENMMMLASYPATDEVYFYIFKNK